MSFFGLTEFAPPNSVSSFQPIICGPKRELTEFLAELTEFAAELSEFFPPKQYYRNSIPPVSYLETVEESPRERNFRAKKGPNWGRVRNASRWMSSRILSQDFSLHLRDTLKP